MILEQLWAKRQILTAPATRRYPRRSCHRDWSGRWSSGGNQSANYLAGIKVINIDIRRDEDLLQKNGVELTYVGPDYETAAQMVGDVLARKLKKDAKVILVEGLRVAENAQQRKKGFLKSIAEYQLNLVASEAADWETDKAEKVFAKLFAEHLDIEGVMCSNDAMANWSN